MVLAYAEDMPDILLCILLFDKADWDSVSVVSGKISSKSVNLKHYDIIDVSYGFYKLNERIDLKNLCKTAWCNYLSV